MRMHLAGALCALALAMPLALAGTDPGVGGDAERDWATIQALMSEKPSVDPMDESDAFARWLQDRSRRLRQLATRFYETYPADPRRWDAVAMTLAESVNVPLGEDEEAAWASRLEQMRIALERAPDASPGAREQAAAYRINRTLMALYSLQSDIDAMAKRFPEGTLAGHIQDSYLRWLETHSPEEFNRLLARLLESPNKWVREAANGRLQLRQARTEPLEMKFTALDGRKVDLADLRGKVVLIEFWATWCKPCIAEIPNLKSVYERYHQQGFEIIGIALDDEKDREKLLAAIGEHELSWPQYFDGNGWDNPYRARFAINGIPAALLLDQDGKLVTTEVRGGRLETEVVRLLGLVNQL